MPMTSHQQRYRLGPVTVSRIGFGENMAVADIDLDAVAREALASAG